MGMCLETNTAQGANTAEGEAQCCICLRTLSAVFFIHTSLGGALIAFLVLSDPIQPSQSSKQLTE